MILKKKLLEFQKILSKTLTKEKKPLFCNDLSEFPQIQKFLLTKKLGSFYAWPIIINGKTTGTFTIASKNIKGILNEDIELINSVIPQISLISENTMNLKRNQNLINVYSALHRASVAITADKDYKLWLDQVLKNAASIYDYQFFAIILNEKRSFKTIGLYGISENNYNLWKKDHLDSVIAETINNCNNIVHPVNFSNVPLKDEPYVHSWMSMPLNTGNTTFGAIITGNFYPRIYNNEEIEIFNLLSEKITQGLFNFSLYNNVLMEKSRIETIIESQGEGLIIINLERKITHFNKAAELITSYSSSDVIGKDCSHIFKGREIDGDLRCETNCPLIELMNDPDNVKDKYFSESLIIDKKGEEKILSCVHSILKFNSEIFGVLIVFRDITSEKLNQQIKTDFIAGISHDLRTPLSAIKGYASTLLTNEEEFDECTRREFLEVISGEVDHLTRLLDNLMDITKIEAGAIKPYIEEMILAPVLEKAVKTHQFSTKKHKIILNLIDTDTIVLADMYMLQRILNNLINNAIKYSPEGGSIIISAEKKEDMCLISIKDEGLGISEEDQKHIFERFKRSSSKKKNRVWGSGVGLFIVKTLISSINGNIRVESQLGKGTTFFLTLPLYKNEGEIK